MIYERNGENLPLGVQEFEPLSLHERGGISPEHPLILQAKRERPFCDNCGKLITGNYCSNCANDIRRQMAEINMLDETKEADPKFFRQILEWMPHKLIDLEMIPDLISGETYIKHDETKGNRNSGFVKIGYDFTFSDGTQITRNIDYKYAKNEPNNSNDTFTRYLYQIAVMEMRTRLNLGIDPTKKIKQDQDIMIDFHNDPGFSNSRKRISIPSPDRQSKTLQTHQVSSNQSIAHELAHQYFEQSLNGTPIEMVEFFSVINGFLVAEEFSHPHVTKGQVLNDMIFREKGRIPISQTQIFGGNKEVREYYFLYSYSTAFILFLMIFRAGGMKKAKEFYNEAINLSTAKRGKHLIREILRGRFKRAAKSFSEKNGQRYEVALENIGLDPDKVFGVSINELNQFAGKLQRGEVKLYDYKPS